MLPDGNGLRLLEHIKQLRKRENVIIISARDSLEDKVLGLEQGEMDTAHSRQDADEDMLLSKAVEAMNLDELRPFDIKRKLL